MARDRDPFRIPRVGWEAAPLAALVSIPLPGSAGSARFLSESTLGAVVVYATYQALLSGLRSEALVRRGELQRGQQARLILATVWEAMKDGAAIGLAFSLVLLVLPWIAVPLGVLGVVGIGKASLDLVHAFWDGLSTAQRRELHEAAYAAGVSLHRLLRDAEPELPAS
ncbi:MAG: hypothetical protein VKJ44_02935 [Synechococcus sp.]|nr:hypothetical protein [Synechococcus sp.]